MQRYDLKHSEDVRRCDFSTMAPDQDGDYILYADHEQAVAQARSALAECIAIIDELHVESVPVIALREALAALSPTDSGK